MLDNNDTLTKIDLTQNPPTQVGEVRVGNVPNSVVISRWPTAYVSNEAGRVAPANDFQEYSNGTPVVAHSDRRHRHRHPLGGGPGLVYGHRHHLLTGLHPTGMAFWGQYLLVADTYSDNISVIDTTTNQEVRKINLGLPIGVPGAGRPPMARAEHDRRR